MTLERLSEISNAVISGDLLSIEKLVNDSLDADVPAIEIINNGLIAGMMVVGDRFKKNEIFIPEVMMSARVMKTGLDILKPLIAKSELEAKAIILIATVKGDVHDIGKNLVAMMFEGAGFNVIDLGIDTAPDTIVEAVRNFQVQVVALSALLTTTMPVMKTVISELEKNELRNKVKIIVGGAAVTQTFADEIGADGYAPDAATAVDKVNELLNLL
jgi:5-methyltetrahydrofolate--homocysteine methyltransferase